MNEYLEAGKVAAGAILAKGPLTKLIEVAQAAVGTWYKPKAMRSEAEAKAYEVETMAYAQAKADIIKSNAESEMADRARHRLYKQEMQRQQNLESILDQTENNLTETVSATPIDEDWRTRFFNIAQDVTSSELQTIWAKILAAEINLPGSVSVRTLEVLKNLSKFEAEKFERFCSLMFAPGQILKADLVDLRDFDLTYGQMLVLKDVGLVFNDEKLHRDFSASGKNKYTHQDKLGIKIKFGVKELFIYKSKSKYLFPVYSLTIAGIQISTIFEVKFNYKYLEHTIKYLSNQGYEVSELN